MMEKKKVILTLCRVFPVTHSKKGQPTMFREKLLNQIKGYDCHSVAVYDKEGNKSVMAISDRKIHTIRGNKKGVWDERYKGISSGRKFLSIREWMGRPYNSEQKEIAQLPNIGLQHVTMTYGSDDAYPQIWIDDKLVPIQEVAKNDGLSVEDFVEWFFGNNKGNTFEGVVIHFTDFRY